jgi:hypothetical protein
VNHSDHWGRMIVRPRARSPPRPAMKTASEIIPMRPFGVPCGTRLSYGIASSVPGPGILVATTHSTPRIR